MAGPCVWPVVWPEACRELDPVRAERTAAMLAMATDMLWAWTGRRFGVCPVTVELAHDVAVCGCDGGGSTYVGRGAGVVAGGRGGSPWRPVLLGGVVTNVSCGCWRDPCVCPPAVAGGVVLPGPVAEVTEVRVGGVPLLDEDWHVLPGGVLARVDGAGWPHDGLVVDYGRGVPVPVGGQIAVGVLAWELSLAVECPDDCQLPQRLTAITRQGVSVAVMDPFADLADGRTGIWLIDSWVSSVTQAPSGGSVLSPDVWCRPVRRGWRVTG